jgi:hypothetical protein
MNFKEQIGTPIAIYLLHPLVVERKQNLAGIEIQSQTITLLQVMLIGVEDQGLWVEGEQLSGYFPEIQEVLWEHELQTREAGEAESVSMKFFVPFSVVALVVGLSRRLG